MRRVHVIKLTKRQRQEREAIIGRRSNPAGIVCRARVILLSAADESGVAIAEKLDLSMVSVSRIRRRFIDGGVEAVAERPMAGRKDHAVEPEVEKQIVELAMSPPPAGRSRGTTRLIGKQMGLTSGCISDILRRNGMKPHLVRTYKVSRDPQPRWTPQNRPLMERSKPAKERRPGRVWVTRFRSPWASGLRTSVMQSARPERSPTTRASASASFAVRT